MGPTAVYVHVTSSDLHAGVESKRWHERNTAFFLQRHQRCATRWQLMPFKLYSWATFKHKPSGRGLAIFRRRAKLFTSPEHYATLYQNSILGVDLTYISQQQNTIGRVVSEPPRLRIRRLKPKQQRQLAASLFGSLALTLLSTSTL